MKNLFTKLYGFTLSDKMIKLQLVIVVILIPNTDCGGYCTRPFTLGRLKAYHKDLNIRNIT